MKHLSLPLNAACVMALRVGEPVMVSGLVVTARDRAHKWLYETFVQGHMLPTAEDRAIYQELATILKGGAIYHCGPIVKKDEDGWHLVAAGPTTSEREEPYEAAVMKHFQVRLIIGKGGMGKRTLQACCEVPALYLNAVGGAAVVAAARIPRIISVHKLDFGDSGSPLGHGDGELSRDRHDGYSRK